MNALHPYQELILVKFGFQNRDLDAISKIRQVERCGETYRRTDLFKEFSERWILFFDADCELQESQITAVRIALPHLSKKTIYAGRYHNSSKASSFVRAYNFVCNTWADANNTFLGGCFLLFAGPDLQAHDLQIEFSKAPMWGGEETCILNLLSPRGYHLKKYEPLNVIHKPNQSVMRFLSRAFIHGAHRTRREAADSPNLLNGHMPSLKPQLSGSFLFWAQKMRGLTIAEIFWVLIHFFFVCAGLIFQRIDQLVRRHSHIVETQSEKSFPKSRLPVR